MGQAVALRWREGARRGDRAATAAMEAMTSADGAGTRRARGTATCPQPREARAVGIAVPARVRAPAATPVRDANARRARTIARAPHTRPRAALPRPSAPADSTARTRGRPHAPRMPAERRTPQPPATASHHGPAPQPRHAAPLLSPATARALARLFISAHALRRTPRWAPRPTARAAPIVWSAAFAPVRPPFAVPRLSVRAHIAAPPYATASSVPAPAIHKSSRLTACDDAHGCRPPRAPVYHVTPSPVLPLLHTTQRCVSRSRARFPPNPYRRQLPHHPLPATCASPAVSSTSSVPTHVRYRQRQPA